MLRKPWESDELSEDWVDEDSSNGLDKAPMNDSSLESRKSFRHGYGTVKISAAGPKLTLNQTATRTLQSGGTLIINDQATAVSSVSSQGTVKAGNHLQWKKRTTDLFTPLQLETMFNAPGSPGSRQPSLRGAPLRRVSGRRTVRFNSKPASQTSSLVSQTNPTKVNEIKREESTPLKRTRSETDGQTDSMRLSHSLLFQLDYDAKTRNCLTAIASKIEANQNPCASSESEDEPPPPATSPVSQSPVKGSLRKMSSAPSQASSQPPKPITNRLLTPHPSWQWLRSQVEVPFVPPEPELETVVQSDESEEVDETDVLDHEWLRQVSIEPANESYLSNIDFVDNLSASQELADFHPKASSTLNSVPSSEGTRLFLPRSPSPISDRPESPPAAPSPNNLWDDIFLSEPHEGGHGHLGPDRAADHLKRHGVLPSQVESAGLILIKPSQVGQVPKQVNNMRYNSVQMKWEPIHVPEEEDPFVGVKTLAISPEELTQQLASLNTTAKDVSPTKLSTNSTPRSNVFPHNPLRPFQQSPQQTPRATPRGTPRVTPRATPRQTPQQTPHSSMSKATNAFRAALSPKNNALLARSKVPLTTTQSLTQKYSAPTTSLRLFPSSGKITTIPASPKGPPKGASNHANATPPHDQPFHGWFIPTSPSASRPFLNPVNQSTQTDPSDYLDPANNHSPTGSTSRSLTTTPPLSTPKASSRGSNPARKGSLLDPHQSFEKTPTPSFSQASPRHSFYNDIRSLTDNHPLTFRQLRHITLVSVGLTSAKGFSCLAALKTLDLSRNSLRGLEGLAAPRLLKLIVDFNALTRFPTCLGVSLPSLERIEATGNALVSIHGLRECRNLKALGVAGNRIKSLKESYPSLRSLKLSGNPLEAISPSSRFENLESLYLDNLCSPFEIPSNFEAGFPALQNLSLRHSHVSHGHPSRRSPSLHCIRAEGSPLIMPRLHGWAGSLAILELQRCELNAFPFETLEQMPQLIALDLSHNLIHSFGADAPVAHPKLTWLNLAANRISSITKLYSGLLPAVPQLKALDLRENPLGSSLRLDHHDHNVSALYQAGLKAQLPYLIKLDGRRISQSVTPSISPSHPSRVLD